MHHVVQWTCACVPPHLRSRTLGYAIYQPMSIRVKGSNHTCTFSWSCSITAVHSNTSALELALLGRGCAPGPFGAWGLGLARGGSLESWGGWVWTSGGEGDRGRTVECRREGRAARTIRRDPDGLGGSCPPQAWFLSQTCAEASRFLLHAAGTPSAETAS